jgi:hypothetical protein
VRRPDAKTSAGTGTELASISKQIETVKKTGSQAINRSDGTVQVQLGCPFARDSIEVAECAGQTLGGFIPGGLMPGKGIMNYCCV